MSLTRRQCIQSGMAAAVGAMSGQARTASYFGVHPFIESNPGAVFIRRTRVPAKTDEAAKLRESIALAREIFVPLDRPGVPVSHRVILKPNGTFVRSKTRPAVDLLGTSTDPQFYEGLVMGLKELGLKKFHFIEANHFERWNLHGYVDINKRHGIVMNEPERPISNYREGEGLTSTKVPDAVVYTRIPHFAPVNEPGTWLLNIAKWKSHSMCMTLAVKNEQGMVVRPYIRFCSGWEMVKGVPDFMKPDIHPEAESRIKRYFENHRKLGYARYDLESDDPMRQEIWAQKTCDHMSVLNTGLSMIEGIYGRDGDAFTNGDDHLTNLVMFGKDKFRLDVVALWLAGHEPGNVHLYRIAKERGLSSTFNPWEVPIYEWAGGKAVTRKLTDFPRTPLKTRYLRRPGEPEYHMVNEPFDYDRVKA